MHQSMVQRTAKDIEGSLVGISTQTVLSAKKRFGDLLTTRCIRTQTTITIAISVKECSAKCVCNVSTAIHVVLEQHGRGEIKLLSTLSYGVNKSD